MSERVEVGTTTVAAIIKRANGDRVPVYLYAVLYDDHTARFPELDGLMAPGDEAIIPTGEELWGPS